MSLKRLSAGLSDGGTADRRQEPALHSIKTGWTVNVSPNLLFCLKTAYLGLESFAVPKEKATFALSIILMSSRWHVSTVFADWWIFCIY